MAETPSVVFVTDKQDFQLPFQTCSLPRYCHTEQMADCFTLWVHRMQNFAVRLMSVPLADWCPVDADCNRGCAWTFSIGTQSSYR